MLRRILFGLLILVLLALGYAALFLAYIWFTFTFWRVIPAGLLPTAPEAAVLLLIAPRSISCPPSLDGRNATRGRF